MSGFSKKDAAKETGSSNKETSRAWHQARDDAASSGQLNERNENKTSDSEEGSAIWGFIKGIFGKSDD
jgi:hypothetical protein